tara:strand:- start:477 stop:1718 length:1242 start_codon:yes stop_codon:yes gene_type:complete
MNSLISAASDALLEVSPRRAPAAAASSQPPAGKPAAQQQQPRAVTDGPVGQTLPRQLDADFYSRILAAPDPAAAYGVPVREDFLHFSVLAPGHIYVISRAGWDGAPNRGAQKRLRDSEDQSPGGWNRRGMPKDVPIPSEPPGGYKLIIEAFAAKVESLASNLSNAAEALALPRKLEIWRVSQDYHLHLNTEDREPVPAKVLIHYLKEDAPVPSDVPPPAIMKTLEPGGGTLLCGDGLLFGDLPPSKRERPSSSGAWDRAVRPAESGPSGALPSRPRMDVDDSAGAPRSREPTFICPADGCGRVFASYDGLAQHKGAEHPGLAACATSADASSSMADAADDFVEGEVVEGEVVVAGEVVEGRPSPAASPPSEDVPTGVEPQLQTATHDSASSASTPLPAPDKTAAPAPSMHAPR